MFLTIYSYGMLHFGKLSDRARWQVSVNEDCEHDLLPKLFLFALTARLTLK